MLRRFKFYRRLQGGIWYLHQFTGNAGYRCSSWIGSTFWAKYDKINKYSRVIEIEIYDIDNSEITEKNG